MWSHFRLLNVTLIFLVFSCSFLLVYSVFLFLMIGGKSRKSYQFLFYPRTRLHRHICQTVSGVSSKINFKLVFKHAAEGYVIHAGDTAKKGIIMNKIVRVYALKGSAHSLDNSYLWRNCRYSCKPQDNIKDATISYADFCTTNHFNHLKHCFV